MSLPDKNEDYKDVGYWNERYGKEEEYEWCKDYASFKPLFNSAVPDKNARILVIGKEIGIQLVRLPRPPSLSCPQFPLPHGSMMEITDRDFN